MTVPVRSGNPRADVLRGLDWAEPDTAVRGAAVRGAAEPDAAEPDTAAPDTPSPLIHGHHHQTSHAAASASLSTPALLTQQIDLRLLVWFAKSMNDSTSPNPPSDEGRNRPNRGAGFVVVGAILVVVGVGLLFVDGLTILSWMLIPGGIVWLIIGLTSGRHGAQAKPASSTRPRDRRDDGGTAWVSSDASGPRPDRSPDDQPSNDSTDGGGSGFSSGGFSGGGLSGSDGGGGDGGGGGGD